MSFPIVRPEDAGFVPLASGRDGPWQIPEESPFEYRLLRSMRDLETVEPLQRAVFGVTDRDLMAASMLITLSETGGDVIGIVDTSGPAERLAGFITALGGFVDGSPVLCSDMMAIDPAYRLAGLGTNVKRLQAALAIERGFEKMTWTVDPLRAANARLNFGKLGAFSDRYERNRYGATYGTGLYGGMPTDRVHVTWPLRTDRVQRVLLGDPAGVLAPAVRTVPIPTDIDELVARDPARALDWRLRVRDALERGMGEGLAITGLGTDDEGTPSLLLTAQSTGEEGRT